MDSAYWSADWQVSGGRGCEPVTCRLVAWLAYQVVSYNRGPGHRRVKLLSSLAGTLHPCRCHGELAPPVVWWRRSRGAIRPPAIRTRVSDVMVAAWWRHGGGGSQRALPLVTAERGVQHKPDQLTAAGGGCSAQARCENEWLNELPTRRPSKVGLVLCHRRRRWHNTKPAFVVDTPLIGPALPQHLAGIEREGFLKKINSVYKKVKQTMVEIMAPFFIH